MANPSARRSVVIRNVPWETYEAVLEAFDERNNARFAYDNGSLEVMAPLELGGHFDCELLGDVAKESARAFGIPIRGGGSVTLRRKDLLKGIEPDNCYWLANAPKLAGVRHLDLAIHPPPDLVLEVDVTNDSLDKLPIYAAIGVPEVWWLDGDELRFHQLGADGNYTEVPASVAFPGVAPADLMPFVKEARAAADQGAVTRAFREWVKSRRESGA